jgi:hypothetical protein
MKKVIVLVAVSVLLFAGCVYCVIKLSPAPNPATPGTATSRTLGVYVDEEPMNPQNLKEINIADITVANDGNLTLNILKKDAPQIKQLQKALKEIAAKPTLTLTGENEIVVNGQKVLAMQGWEVKKGEPDYIHAVAETLRMEFGFKAEIKK